MSNPILARRSNQQRNIGKPCTAAKPPPKPTNEKQKKTGVPFTLGQVGHFGLAVREPKKSAKWFERAFGLGKTLRVRGRPAIGNDDVTVALHKSKPSPETIDHMSFHLPDLKANSASYIHHFTSDRTRVPRDAAARARLSLRSADSSVSTSRASPISLIRIVEIALASGEPVSLSGRTWPMRDSGWSGNQDAMREFPRWAEAGPAT